MDPMTPIARLADQLAAGETTSVALTDAALARAADPAGEGGNVFIELYADRARAEAENADRMRAAGIVPSPIAGLPISVKDLFDVAGSVTRAGSKAIADDPPAKSDSEVVRRLRAAGAVIVGRTNLTEFAYSGIGINPHYGTPANPWDRDTGRIPGGSSSGAAVSVTDGMAAVGIGTDTGGSVRIPAALCGITGFKSTTGRIPTTDVYPLSATLDSVGPLAPTVACCAVIDAIMAGENPTVPTALPLTGLRLAVPQTCVMDDLDDTISAAFSAALSKLSAAGAVITDIPFSELGEVTSGMPHGGILGAEAWSIHRHLLDDKSDLYDPRIRVRIDRGKNLSAADLIDVIAKRQDVMARANATTAPFDAVLMPTTAKIAPPIADIVASEDLYAEMNPLMLRNTTTGNYLDRCAMSIPCHADGDAPVGLMVMDETGADRHLVRVSLAIEAALRT